MTGDRRSKRRDGTSAPGEEPSCLPPIYSFALIAVLALVIAATFL